MRAMGPKKIRLEELVHFFWNAFFHGSAVAIAGVIDEDVDGAKALQAFFYGILMSSSFVTSRDRARACSG